MSTTTNLAVIGGGAWGTALAIHAAREGAAVRLWVREHELVEAIRAERTNPLYLPGVTLPRAIEPTTDVAQAVQGASLLLAVVPSQFARGVYREMAPHLAADATLVVASKGIEEDRLSLPLEVAAEEFGDGVGLAVLSGPSFAIEVAEAKPCAVVVAASSEALAAKVQQACSSERLRLYTSPDPLGVQLAGALKNVIAIAAGVADSLDTGGNAVAALITRGLAEISRLGLALGARAETFAGLAGLGDLVLTCTGELSRNRRVGQALGRGQSLDEILASTRSVAEGVRTTRSALQLARRESVEMPLVEEVHRLLFEGASPAGTIERLMRRPLTSEQLRR